MFKNHPKGLILAALSNMGERFGYYIMNAVLLLFLLSKFGLDNTTGTIIYSCFYAGIYVLGLVGGLIADRTQNYKGTIISGLIVMALGYVVLSIPILSTSTNIYWLLPLTCAALFLIAFGNGLFKGNLQAIVGQMYDDKKYSANRDSGFQIFYVFINIGAFIAPFVAPLLRGWWLNSHDLTYNSELPALCHQYLNDTANMAAAQLGNLNELAVKVSGSLPTDLTAFCSNYLDIFNTGVHFSFIASVVAMLISLVIFIASKKIFPNPAKKETKVLVDYTVEEKKAMAVEIKQRIYALFAVLGIAVFFWFSFHQNGASLSLFAKDFVITDRVPPEVWQAINPILVILLTPVIMFIFSILRRKGKEISTPKKIAIGMGIAGCAFLFMMIISLIKGYPSSSEFLANPDRESLKYGAWVLFVLYFFLTVAELFISPLGLSFVSKVAPKHLQGLCQGLWLAATAVGNGILWVGPWLYSKYDISVCWIVFAAVCAVSMIVMLSMVKWLERVTK
ncbi:MAG: peptide MFS transporter [Bacteroidales bacterium]|jgi:POT family proton-dependent oligopeptide transporter|nr:peptide MFS transporter [Bacteroidales bacterium]